MPFALHRQFASSKVPRVTPVFWYLKILTTAMGEATSDYFVNRFDPKVAVVVTGVVFFIVLWWQLRSPTYEATTYWAAIVMVSVFGTMCADVVHVAFHVPYIVSALGFSVALIAVFLWWHHVEGTLSIHSITSSRRELFYFLTVTVAFALGTAVGDLTAITFHLGFFGSGLLYTGLILLPLMAFAVARRHTILLFWIAYVLTRPLGASFADAMGKPRTAGGLGWGSGTVSLSLSALIVVSVAAVALAQRRDEAL